MKAGTSTFTQEHGDARANDVRRQLAQQHFQQGASWSLYWWLRALGERIPSPHEWALAEHQRQNRTGLGVRADL